MVPNSGQGIFARFGIVTIVSVYLLILVGGIVRSSGSGMGCPDWPKCFGRWVPPTEESQLPENYQDIYKERGYQHAKFNPVKTWVEYLNRLVGVLIGFFIFLTLIFSLNYRKTDKIIPVLAFVAFILVGFEGWLGSVVVKTNLAPWLVTVHMGVSLIIVALLIYIVFKAVSREVNQVVPKQRSLINGILLSCMVATFLQILLGTQVREEIDVISAAFNYENREIWIESLGTTFTIHRTFAILVLGLHFYLVYLLMKDKEAGNAGLIAKILAGIILVEILSGIVLSYFSIPAFIQPIHLLLASIAFGLQFLLLLMMNLFEKIKANKTESLNFGV